MIFLILKLPPEGAFLELWTKDEKKFFVVLFCEIQSRGPTKRSMINSYEDLLPDFRDIIFEKKFSCLKFFLNLPHDPKLFILKEKDVTQSVI